MTGVKRYAWDLCDADLVEVILSPDIIITSRSFFHFSRSNIITMALRHNEDIPRFAVMEKACSAVAHQFSLPGDVGLRYVGSM